MNTAYESINSSAISFDKIKVHHIIKDLISVNNDRIEGYNAAVYQIKDRDLKEFCNKLSIQSEQFNIALKELILYPTLPDEVTLVETLYRACIYVKSPSLLNDRERILLACKVGENMALNSYKKALKENIIKEQIRSKLELQKVLLTNSLHEIKLLKV
ncbi:MAG: DUF2383 domain-containing protein [Bacteroidia bacterium]|nr:DUF2383 domain-containing protein [Bacteroidia bacterium]